MSQGFGSESPRTHAQTSHRKPARFLVVIDSGGTTVARLFLETREQVAEFDAGTEEAAQMTAGLAPTQGADGPEWDRALDGHSAVERRAADVYTLDI
jgi:RecA/RadA recombinase